MTIEEMQAELLEIWNKHNPDQQATQASVSTGYYLVYPNPTDNEDMDSEIGIPAVQHYPRFMINEQWLVIPVLSPYTNLFVSEDIPEQQQYEAILNCFRLRYKEYDHMSDAELLSETDWDTLYELDRRIAARKEKGE